MREFSDSHSSFNSSVAAATGETTAEIRRRGFSLVGPADNPPGLEPLKAGPSTIDWDELQGLQAPAHVRRRPAAA